MKETHQIFLDESFQRRDEANYPLGIEKSIYAVNASIYGSRQALDKLAKQTTPYSKYRKWKTLGKPNPDSGIESCTRKLALLFDFVAKGDIKIMFSYASTVHSENGLGTFRSPTSKGKFNIAKAAIKSCALHHSEPNRIRIISDGNRHDEGTNLTHDKQDTLRKIAQGVNGSIIKFTNQTAVVHVQIADYLAGFFAWYANGFLDIEGDFGLQKAQRISAKNRMALKILEMLDHKLGMRLDPRNPKDMIDMYIASYPMPEAKPISWDEVPYIQITEVCPPR